LTLSGVSLLHLESWGLAPPNGSKDRENVLLSLIEDRFRGYIGTYYETIRKKFD
jgi:hypothetical protein